MDVGDVDGEVFRPDPVADTARNLSAVLRVAQRVAEVVEEHVRDGHLPIVLGGDCTISLGVVAGLQRVRPDVGVAYIDGDADLSSPERTRSGILDATGAAHLLGVATTALASIGVSQPMLQAHQLVLLGYDPYDHDSFDADLIAARPELLHFSDADLRADVGRCALRALTRLEQRDAVLVHFDVDCIDSRELPLANFPTTEPVSPCRPQWASYR